ncbi:MAG: N-formylglutamate amidohydrolase [Nanoarchaeota archaeon]|nr:N-formylglutamate amidohydrolase [Nanoarchaeota archaeon]
MQRQRKCWKSFHRFKEEILIKVKDILTGKTKKIKSSELVFCEKKSRDYILSIPHSGTLVPSSMLKKIKISKSMLIGTDLFTRELYNNSRGIHVVSLLNIYSVNMNRFKHPKKNNKMPIHMRSDPLHEASLTGQTILKNDYSESEKNVLMRFYKRFHGLIENSISEMKKQKGFALMFDCHSMNSRGLENTPDKGKERPDFSIGTLHGNSADNRIIRSFYNSIKEQADELNLDVKKDKPYSGGFITQKYGNVLKKINVFQLEVKRNIYMEGGLNGTSGKAFTQKKGRLSRINSIVSGAFDAASKRAEQIFQ